ncbi:MAG: hypothetical protein QW688_09525 [Thermoprotei archaeon]
MSPRSLEVVYYEGQTHILLSASNMERYELALANVYGQLNLTPPPDVLSELFRDKEVYSAACIPAVIRPAFEG